MTNRKLNSLIFTISVLCLFIGACGNNNKQVFPRPEAYPRPNLPDTVLVETDLTPLVFEVNSQARVSAPRQGWLDVDYPTLNATIHITFTNVSDEEIEKVKRNRMERLMLNAGDRGFDMAEFSTSAGFDIIMARSEHSSTPVQFLATDDSAWVVSGAVYFHSADAVNSLDSVRPMVNALANDISRALRRMTYR